MPVQARRAELLPRFLPVFFSTHVAGLPAVNMFPVSPVHCASVVIFALSPVHSNTRDLVNTLPVRPVQANLELLLPPLSFDELLVQVADLKFRNVLK
jgi:hypothetical protein